MAKGILAEIQRSQRKAAANAERQRKEAVRKHNAAVKAAEKALKDEERALAKAAKADEADKKRLLKEAQAAHIEAMQAKVEEKNTALAEVYADLEGLLQATLEVDDYVDLESLRQVSDHPPFDRTDLEKSVPPPPTTPEPAEPVFVAPEPVKSLIGKKKKTEAAMTSAKAAHEQALSDWEKAKTDADNLRQKQAAKHADAESSRKKLLERELARFKQECDERDRAVADANAELDMLIANLGYGTAEALQEYVSIVLANSAYPEHFVVSHESFEFDPSTAELALKVHVPPPGAVSDVKAYKYTKSSDEITHTNQSQKASKDRYATAVHQVALRTLHEIFESDRRALINTLSLNVGTSEIDPATGVKKDITYVAVATEREAFMAIELASVLPSATLDHLGAAVSKNPFGLVGVTTSGVRKS